MSPMEIAGYVAVGLVLAAVVFLVLCVWLDRRHDRELMEQLNEEHRRETVQEVRAESPITYDDLVELIERDHGNESFDKAVESIVQNFVNAGEPQPEREWDPDFELDPKAN